MRDPLPWLILVPLLWATLAFAFGAKWGGRLAVAGCTLQLALAFLLAGKTGGGLVLQHPVGGWEIPLGIELSADGLSALMVIFVQALALPLLIYARSHFSDQPAQARSFWPLAGYLLAAANGLFLSADLFNLYVTLELVSLAAVGMVALSGTATGLSAALRYLFSSLAGSTCYLFGVALLYGSYGSVSLSVIAATEPPPGAEGASLLAALLMLTGMALKTALFPLHFWLPPAHGGADAPVSALLSALVIKTSFYLAVRLWLVLFAPLDLPALGQLLGVLGAIAIGWGSFMALRQKRLKMLVAYSTVAQVGYLFLFFPIAATGSPEALQSAWQGVTLQIFSHGLAKAAMFASVGAIVAAIGHDRIDALGGVSSHLPLSLFSFALAGVSLMGLPPSVGFLAKWLLIDGAIAGRQPAWIIVIVAGGLLTALYVFRVLRHAFVRSEQSPSFRNLPRTSEWPAFVLALGSLLLGLRVTEILALLGTP